MTDHQERLDAFGRLRAALASAGEGGGVGCHFWTRPTFGVPAAQLEALGLVKIIKTRVPICEAHGCAAIETCSERVSFVERKGGIGNWKFRLTVLGEQAVAQADVLARQVAAQPLADAILAALAGTGKNTPTSWPALYWRLLEPELTLIEETGQRPSPPVSRSSVRLYLDLLIAAGLVQEDPAAGTVWHS